MIIQVLNPDQTVHRELMAPVEVNDQTVADLKVELGLGHLEHRYVLTDAEKTALIRGRIRTDAGDHETLTKTAADMLHLVLLIAVQGREAHSDLVNAIEQRLANGKVPADLKDPASKIIDGYFDRG